MYWQATYTAMKRIVLLTASLLIFSVAIFAQDEGEGEQQKGFDRSRLFVGGNFGMSFGSYTWVNLSPQVGYRFNKNFAAGIGINAQYSQLKYYSGDEVIARDEYGIAGMNVFGRLYPIPQLFAQLQPELNYIWGSYKEYYSDNKSSLDGTILPSLLVGAGALLPMGRNGGMTLMLQYDLLYKSGVSGVKPGTPYGNNVFFSIGFNVGL